jgi:hypothetical protein
MTSWCGELASVPTKSSPDKSGPRRPLHSGAASRALDGGAYLLPNGLAISGVETLELKFQLKKYSQRKTAFSQVTITVSNMYYFQKRSERRAARRAAAVTRILHNALRAFLPTRKVTGIFKQDGKLFGLDPACKSVHEYTLIAPQGWVQTEVSFTFES